MSYLGSPPQFAQFPSKFFDGDGTAMTVTLDYAPPNLAALLVFISGVRQDTSAYTLSGTSLTFTGTVPSGTANVQVVHLGQLAEIPTPGDDTVSTAKIQDNAVTLVKLEDGTQGDILYYGASGAPARLGFGTSGYFLKTQGTGANPVWAAAGVDTLAALTDATISSSDPTVSSNPTAVGHLWLNSTSGEGYIATDATGGANVWRNIGVGMGNIGGSYTVDFLCIAGGGSGGGGGGGDGGTGGGGAGGYRNSFGSEASGGGGSSETAMTLSTGTVYTIDVGAGAASPGAAYATNDGANSSISGTGLTTITSTGGGGGGFQQTTDGNNGGSGGGAAQNSSAGSGTSNQGYDGGTGFNSVYYGVGGGGGASAVGGNGSSLTGGDGGAGLASSITETSTVRGGGGGGGVRYNSSPTTSASSGGSGGGGAGANGGAGSAGTDGLGGGGGGAGDTGAGGAGGDGVVILRMPSINFSGTATGSPTISEESGSSGLETILVFTGDGTYTA